MYVMHYGYIIYISDSTSFFLKCCIPLKDIPQPDDRKRTMVSLGITDSVLLRKNYISFQESSEELE